MLAERYEADEQYIDKLKKENAQITVGNSEIDKYRLEYYLIKEHSTENKKVITSYLNGFRLSPFSSGWSCGFEIATDMVSCNRLSCERFLSMSATPQDLFCPLNTADDPIARSKFSSFQILLSTVGGVDYDQDFNTLEREAESYTTPKGQQYYLSLDKNKNEVITYFSKTPIEKSSRYSSNPQKYGKYVIQYLPFHENGLVTKNEEAKMKVFTESIIDHTSTVTSQGDNVPYF